MSWLIEKQSWEGSDSLDMHLHNGDMNNKETYHLAFLHIGLV